MIRGKWEWEHRRLIPGGSSIPRVKISIITVGLYSSVQVTLEVVIFSTSIA